MANTTIREHVTCFCHISYHFLVRNDLKHHSKQHAAATRPRIRIASGSKPCLYTDSTQYSEAACSAVSSIQLQQAVQQKQHIVTARSVLSSSSSSTSSYAYLRQVPAAHNYCCCMRIQLLLLHEVYAQQQQHTTVLMYAAYSKQQQQYLVRTHAYAYVHAYSSTRVHIYSPHLRKNNYLVHTRTVVHTS